MYARFKINVDEIHKMVHNVTSNGGDMSPIVFDEGKKAAYKSLDYFTTGINDSEKILIGAELQNYVFPVGKDGNYDIFISHSHDDKDIAISLATFLKRFGNFRVFLDSYVWKSADGLLQKIDDRYCRQRNGNYNYHRRNFSTAHIHAMLSMAIMDIINKTDCCIFIESNHSIKISALNNDNTAKTLSPWIYEEYVMMKLLPRRKSTKQIKTFSKAIGITESRELKIAYDADMKLFMSLTCDDVLSLKNRYPALEELYKRYDEYENQQYINKHAIQD